MKKFWKPSSAIGVGLGVGVAGALMLGIRHGFRRFLPEPLPDSLSPESFSTRVCQTSQGEIVYHVCGTGSPMVFLHHPCIGGSSFEWAKVYPAFVKNHEVLALDLPGFGESERPRMALSPENYGRALADFLHVLCPGQPATIVASGLSAGLALLLAAQHPETVSHLILFSPVDPAGHRPHAPGIFRMPGPRILWNVVYQNHFARKPFLRGWLAREGVSSSDRVTDEMVQAFSTCALQYGAEHAIFRMASRRWKLDFREFISRVIHPMLVVTPSGEPGGACEGMVRAVRSLSHVRHREISASGFFLALDDPEACIEILRQEVEFGLRPLDPHGV